jgi:hypothetical protein
MPFRRTYFSLFINHGQKVGKSVFADNQPFGLLRNFEINRSGGSCKQASMPDQRSLRHPWRIHPTA